MRGVAAEALDGPVVALRHGLDAGEQRQDRKHDDDEDEDVEAEQHGNPQPVTAGRYRGASARDVGHVRTD